MATTMMMMFIIVLMMMMMMMMILDSASLDIDICHLSPIFIHNFAPLITIFKNKIDHRKVIPREGFKILNNIPTVNIWD